MITKRIYFGMIMMVLTFVLTLTNCDNGAGDLLQNGGNGNNHTAYIQGRVWLLIEVKTSSDTIRINRPIPDMPPMTYNIRFEEDYLYGGAVPNHYEGPYSSGEGNTLSIEELYVTHMRPFEIEGLLHEDDYFAYLLRVSHWALLDGNLALYSSDEDGDVVILIFIETHNHPF